MLNLNNLYGRVVRQARLLLEFLLRISNPHSDLSITLGLMNIIFTACDPTVINASSPANIPAVRKGKKDRGVWYAKELSHLSEK
jgi:hypothetical protein